MRNYGLHSHTPLSRPPRKRWNNPKSKTNPIMDRNESLNIGLHQGMCSVPTKQNPYALTQGPPLPNHNRRRDAPLPKSSNGPHHRATNTQRQKCDPHHCRPQMLSSGDLFTLLNNNYRTRNHPTIHGPCILMVWTPHKNNQWPRPLLHFSFWQSTQPKTRDPTEPVHHIPPPNR